MNEKMRLKGNGKSWMNRHDHEWENTPSYLINKLCHKFFNNHSSFSFDIKEVEKYINVSNQSLNYFN